jgi:dihydroorotase
VLGFDTNTKVAPPLRSADDVIACREGLVDGTIDAIATDHAPHAVHEKDQEYTAAPHGLIGFETAVPVVLDLVRKQEISPLELVRRMTSNPARILCLPGGCLEVSGVADVTVVDPERRWTYDPVKGYSKSRNSPWAGKEMIGRTIATIVASRLVYHVDHGVLVP